MTFEVLPGDEVGGMGNSVRAKQGLSEVNMKD